VQTGTKINWLDFEVKRSKGKVTVRPHDQISTGAIFSPISGTHGHISMKLITVTGPYDNDDIFKVTSSKFEYNILRKFTFRWRQSHTDPRSSTV